MTFTPPIGEARIARVDYQAERVWCKAATPAPATWRYHALSLLASWLNLPLARPVPKPGGIRSLEIERQRLAALAAADIHVPRILQQGHAWHLLSDIGPSLRILLGKANIDDRVTLSQRAVLAVKNVHRKGQYLSQAFERNICVAGDVVGFIDFEDDPAEIYSLPEAQARDLLLLLNSLARYFTGHEQRFSHLCELALSGLSTDQVDAIFVTVVGSSNISRRVPGAGKIREVECLRLLARILERLHSVQR